MATGTETPDRFDRRRATVLGAYLVVLVVSESLVTYRDPTTGTFTFQAGGLALEILLVFSLTFHGVVVYASDRTLAHALSALSLAPLIRIFSLSIPARGEDILPWLGLVSVPLLISVFAVAYVQRLTPRDLGLAARSARDVAVQIVIALTGLPLGALEFYILRPAAWIPNLTAAGVIVGFVVLFFATGISEELIFRGIMLKRSVEALGRAAGVLFVSLVFASLHIFFGSAADITFVFFVGLFYALVVLRTRSIWGVALSHSLGNAILYLVAPFLLA